MTHFLNYFIPRFVIMSVINLPVIALMQYFGVKWLINYGLVGYMVGHVACNVMDKIGKPNGS